MSLEIYQSAFTAQELESAIAGGRAPSADGLNEFPLEAYTVLGADLQSIGDTIAQKAGVEAPAFPDGWQGAMAGIEKAYMHPTTGIAYFANHVMPEASSGTRIDYFKAAPELVSLVVYGLGAYPFGSAMQNCPKLERVAFPRQTTYAGGNSRTWDNCRKFKELQLGSIGYPVKSVDITAGNASVPKTVTVYCTDPTNVSTLGVVNASDTVIYRSSVTGEVFEL